jgi:type IV secretory pathway VirB4 component
MSYTPFKEEVKQQKTYKQILENNSMTIKNRNIETFAKTLLQEFGGNLEIQNWDQDKLRDIFYAIKKHGDNPKEYIDLHYSVSEEKFNNWPEHIKNIFKPARINKEANND